MSLSIHRSNWHHQTLQLLTFSILSPSGELEKINTTRFLSTPESIVFVGSSVLLGNLTDATEFSSISTSRSDLDHEEVPTGTEDAAFHLIVGLRDVPYLVYLDCTSFKQKTVSLNEREWDTHVSFAPLHLSLSPDGRLLLVATDKSMHVVYRTGTNKRVRLLADHVCGEYGRPRVAWHPSGHYLYSTTDQDSSVLVYALGSERVVGRLNGHRGAVRSLAVAKDGSLLSGSFDKSMRLWSR